MINKYFGLTEINLEKNTSVYVDQFSKAFLPNYLSRIQNNDTSENNEKNINWNSLITKYKNKISLIFVTFNSENWLDSLIIDINESMEMLKEIIIVDNGSIDNSIQHIRKKLPQAKLIINKQNQSFASGINLGIQNSSSEFLFIINPDIRFSAISLLNLIKKASEVEISGVVSPKIKLMDNPQFLNGIGNFVGPFYWGYDCGLGHLDVGQFDHIDTLSSACFAAVLIPKHIIEAVGLLDESYTMYYEDVDWCLRTRINGYRIYHEPQAEIFHAYSGHQRTKKIISSMKLQNVTYGRLRLIRKFSSKIHFSNLLFSYFLFDLIYCFYSLIVLRFHNLEAIIIGWKLFISDYNNIQKSQNSTVKMKFFGPHEKKLFPRIKNGIPVVTKEMIKNGEYV